MTAFPALGALLQAGNRQRSTPPIKLEHHLDRVGLNHSPAAVTGDAQIVASLGEVIDRIELVADHT